MNEGLSTKDAKKLNKASILATSSNPKDWDSARARQVDVDYKDLVRQLKAKKKKKIKESFEIDKDAHNKAKKKAKLRNLARGNENPAEKAAAEKKAGGPKLYGEEDNFSQKDKELKKTKSARNQRYRSLHSGTNTSKNIDVNEGKSYSDWIQASREAHDRVTKAKAEKNKRNSEEARKVAREKGIPFSDKKGKGYIKKGKKVYN